MTESIEPSNRSRPERRIIDRPRLTRMLDETDARVILLLAPAGYGKTTLARQWVKTLNGAIWLSLTEAHRDVVSLAEDLAAGVDALGGNAVSFMRQYVRVRRDPADEALSLATALADQLNDARVQWIAFDDYHEVASSPEVGTLLDLLHNRVHCRFLYASRVRPTWATSRREMYGELCEISRETLAMDEQESRQVLGTRRDVPGLLAKSQGWPAVLALASRTTEHDLPDRALPSALYRFFAEEMYREASQSVRRHLVRLALIPELANDTSASRSARERALNMSARELGFLSADEPLELHPLLREFLLSKLASEGNAGDAVDHAITTSIEREFWDRAFELIIRFDRLDLVESALVRGYKPLLRAGRVATLSRFAQHIRAAPTFPPPAVDLVEAEVALREGDLQIATEIAHRVRAQLERTHPLSARASTIIGRTAIARGDYARAESAFRTAHSCATDTRDSADALFGWALASVEGETGSAEPVMKKLSAKRRESPLDLVRYATAELTRRRFAEGFAGELPIAEALHAYPQTEDPWAKSSFAFSAAYVSALRSEYEQALDLMSLANQEIETFDLEFARPYAAWNIAFIFLGLRRFGAAEKSLQTVEDSTRRHSLGYHVLNSRVLRARVCLASGDTEGALSAVGATETEAAIPSLHGEYVAVRALALAVANRKEEAIRNAAEADKLTRAVEVRLLTQAVRAIVSATDSNPEPATELLRSAAKLGTWDPVVAALRASTPIRKVLEANEATRPVLATLYARSNDAGLARRAGMRTRSLRSPIDVLSPREFEVLGLMARGLRNREIAKALVISESTTKIHVRRVLDKLGVRTRTEAVSRLQQA